MRNTLIDFQRAILIILVILVHIVHFGDLHPDVKSSILAFMMPTFLVITGYLVNVHKTIKKFLHYLLKIALPYTIMVLGYMLVSLYLPVRDGITSFDVHTVCRVLFVTSIGPYWFFRVMIICGICYYLVFRCFQSSFSTNTKYILLGTLLLVVSLLPPPHVISIKSAFYYYLGVGIKIYLGDINKICVGSFWALIPFAVMLSQEDWRDWSTFFVLACVMCYFSVSTQLAKYPKGKSKKALLYIGRNTLPIYIFHPIFTMLSKYTLPFFQYDPSGVLHAVFTIFISVGGNLGIAYFMDKTHFSWMFAYRKMLR